jgi:hypothetical protein
MLLIDGIKYELWTPQKEVEEFHPIVKEHYKEIFGKNTFFIEGSKLKSEAGKGSVPDGFVIELNQNPNWYIVEIELSRHPLYDHIVNQVGRFINGIKNTSTQKKVIETIYHYIQDDKQRKTEFEDIVGSGEIFKYITDLITKQPILAVMIEEKTPDLNEALDLLRYSPIKTVEFRTYISTKTDKSHAHLFEPLFTPSLRPMPQISGDIWVRVTGSELHRFAIPAEYRALFPGFHDDFILIADNEEITTCVAFDDKNIPHGDKKAGTSFSWNLKQWFGKHQSIKEGDKIKVSIIEPMKKYRLEIGK